MLSSKTIKMVGVITIIFCTSAAKPVFSRDLVYQPISPSFGGSPLNGSFVLGLAQANNSRYLESPQAKKDRRENAARNAANGAGNDPALQFQRQITSSLLSQIAGQVSQQIIGENARDSGTFSFGGTQIQFARANGQINIDITESATGGRTNIQIPVPQF